MNNAEYWRLAVARLPQQAADLARDAEEAGWDGILFSDNQHMVSDVYVCLALASEATTSLKLGTSVINPVTRHVAVTAASMSTIQHLSNGRFVVGIGRGDSAVHFIGQHPMKVADFEVYLEQLRRYISRGSNVINGFESNIEWLADSDVPPTPISIAATGPRMIELAGRQADRVTFSLGAIPERLKDAIARADRASEAAGRDPATVSKGAYIIVAATDDVEHGRNVVRGITSIHARFAKMDGKLVDTLNEQDRAATAAMVDKYSEEAHGLANSPQAQALDPEFLHRFAVVGSPEHCVERLQELESLGLDHIYVLCEGRQTPPAERDALYARFAADVVPALRR